jgi:hypothetical protein
MTFETLGYNSTDALGFIYPSRGEFIFLVCYYHINGIHTTSISWQITFTGELKRKGKKKKKRDFCFKSEKGMETS